MALLKVENLTTKYKEVVAVENISFEINEGEIVALIGANGAGKSTTLMTLSGWLKSSAGVITFNGKQIQNKSMHGIVEMGISQCPEGRRIFSDMSVEENLMMGYYTNRAKGKSTEAMDYVFSLFPILKERRNQIGSTLSGGQQQMLAIGRALMGKPKLLMLDEPSLGLAPIIVEKVFQTLSEVHKNGTTILLVEQNARAALTIADRAYVMEVGNITSSGTGKELLNNPEIKRAYLGKK